MVAILALAPAPVRAQRDISPQRECSICHVMWLTEFNREGVSPLIPYEPKPIVATGKQDIVSTERMCFSCHDGFVRDSRFAWANRQHFHPVGVTPSSKVNIPTQDGKVLFPLNDDGKIYCGTCHSAHGINWEEEFSPLFLRAKNIDSSLCLACHIDRATGTKEGNHPVQKPVNSLPQQLLEAGAKFGGQREVICQSCHRVHGAGDRKLLVVPNADSQLCGNCHGEKLAVQGTRHDAGTMPAEAGKSPPGGRLCGSCHAPHKGRGPRMWARPLASGAPDAFSATCLSCHRQGAVAQDKTIGIHSHPVGVPLANLGIAVNGDGWSPSFPSTDGGGKRVVPPRFDQYEENMTKVNDRTCAACHLGKVVLPLYGKDGNRHMNGNISCGTCHDPHRWSPLSNDEKDAAKDAPASGHNSFLRVSNDRDSSLCSNCHADKAIIGLSKHNLGLGYGAEAKQNGAAPGDSSVCGSCHRPHNGKGPRMWSRPDGPGNDTISRMCQECHRSGGNADKKVVGANSHPVQISVTEAGMKTELPLYTADGRHDDSAGTVACTTCHDPHRWNSSDVHDGVESGGSEGNARSSFLRQPASPDGDLCANCHQDKRWIRDTEHDLGVSAPKSQNGKAQTVRDSGVCGQCHAVHNAIEPTRLWARQLGQGQDRQEQLCRSCHASEKVAAAKQPHKANHPAAVVALTVAGKARPGTGETSTLVFGKDGMPAVSGVISCPTCHNPHRWSALREAEGPGKNTEGDARSSFLRNTSDVGLCKNCHGLDALFRYKYFHGESSRQKNSRLYR